LTTVPGLAATKKPRLSQKYSNQKVCSFCGTAELLVYKIRPCNKNP
jgi:hypothetical protein